MTGRNFVSKIVDKGNQTKVISFVVLVRETEIKQVLAF